MYAPEKSWVEDQVRQFTAARDQYIEHQAKLKSINKQTKKRPKLPIYPLVSHALINFLSYLWVRCNAFLKFLTIFSCICNFTCIKKKLRS